MPKLAKMQVSVIVPLMAQFIGRNHRSGCKRNYIP